MKTTLTTLLLIITTSTLFSQNCSDIIFKREDKFEKTIWYKTTTTITFKDFNNNIYVEISKYKHLNSFTIKFICESSPGSRVRLKPNSYAYFLFENKLSFKVIDNNPHEDPGGSIDLVLNPANQPELLKNLLNTKVVALRINYEGYEKDYDLDSKQQTYFKESMICMDF